MDERAFILASDADAADTIFIFQDNKIKSARGLPTGRLMSWALQTFSPETKIDMNKVISPAEPGNLLFIPDSADILFGLTLNIKGADIIRSVFEGIAFSYHSRLISLGMKKSSLEIFTSGNIFTYDAFCQQLANILNKKVSKLKGKTVALLRTLKKQEKYGITESSLLPKIVIDKTFAPDSRSHLAYTKAFQRYRLLESDMTSYLGQLGAG